MIEILPDLALAVVAVLALILIFALTMLGDLLRGTLGRIPGIGPWIDAHLVVLIGLARAGMTVALNGALHGMSWIWHVAAHWITLTVDGIRAALWDISDAVWRVAYVLIPREIRVIEGTARALFRSAEHQVTSLDRAVAADIARAESGFRNDWNKFRGWAAALTAAALAGLAARIDSALAALARQIIATQNQARVWSDEVLAAALTADAADAAAQDAALAAASADLETRIYAARMAAEHDAALAAAAAANDAVTRIDHQARIAMAPEWAAVTAAAASLAGQTATAFPAVSKMFTAIPAVAPDTVAAAVGADASALPPVLTLLADCVVPNCENLSQPGKQFRGLKDLLAGAAFLALITEMVTHPVTAARDTVDVLDKPVTDAVGAVRTLIGA